MSQEKRSCIIVVMSDTNLQAFIRSKSLRVGANPKEGANLRESAKPNKCCIHSLGEDSSHANLMPLASLYLLYPKGYPIRPARVGGVLTGHSETFYFMMPKLCDF